MKQKKVCFLSVNVSRTFLDKKREKSLRFFVATEYFAFVPVTLDRNRELCIFHWWIKRRESFSRFLVTKNKYLLLR